MPGSVLRPVVHDGGMDSFRPRSGGPRLRRSFTLSQKLDHFNACEAACTHGGGAYYRENGLCSAQVTQWCGACDACILHGKKAGSAIGKLTPEQAEIDRLRIELDNATTWLSRMEVSLETMGRAYVLLEDLSKGMDTQTPQSRT
jgi:hypothetical protein